MIEENRSMEGACRICRENNHLVLLVEDVTETNDRYDVLFCRMCNVGFTVPFPSMAELSILYSSGTYRSDSGKRFTQHVETAINYFRQRRRKRIEKYRKNGRILDIGCGRGVFLDIMRKNGWNVTGTEYNKETAEPVMKNYRIDVVNGDPGDWGFSPGSFDVVTMNHVLEHMPDPESTIRECSRLLRKGGLLFVAVPDIMSLQSMIGKHLWFHLDIPYHIYHFSEKGLSSLIEKHGFQLLKVRRFDLEYNPFGWLQTLLNMTGIRKNLFYDFLKNVKSRNIIISKVSKWQIVLSIALIPIYVPISFFLSLFESLVLKKSGTIEIHAVKI